MTAALADIRAHADLDYMMSMCRNMYKKAFWEINELAVQRHLMTDDEFTMMAYDQAIMKYVARAPDGVILGFSAMTNRLTAWPLISPAYFQRRWPAEYEQRRIFYVGFVCTLDGAPPAVFPQLIERMYQEVIAVEGIAVMDFCAHNVHRRMPGVTTRILNRINPGTEGACLDTQSFWAWRFDGGTL